MAASLQVDRCIKCQLEDKLFFLDCHHSVCGQCLLKFKGSSVTCDLCQRQTTTKIKGKIMLRENFIQQEIMAAAEMMGPKRCVPCSVKNVFVVAEFVCPECEGLGICEDCLKQHNRLPVTRTHGPTNIGSLDGIETYIAAQRRVNKHQELTASSVGVRENKEQLDVILEDINLHKVKVWRALNELKQRESNLISDGEAALNEFDNNWAEIVKMVENQRRKMIDDLALFKAERESEEGKRKRVLDIMKNQLDAAEQLVEKYKVFSASPEVQQNIPYIEQATMKTLRRLQADVAMKATCPVQTVISLNEINFEEALDSMGRCLHTSSRQPEYEAYTKSIQSVIDNLSHNEQANLSVVAKWSSTNLRGLCGIDINEANEIVVGGTRSNDSSQCLEIYTMKGELVRTITHDARIGQLVQQDESILIACSSQKCIKIIDQSGDTKHVINAPETSLETEPFCSCVTLQGDTVYMGLTNVLRAESGSLYRCKVGQNGAERFPIHNVNLKCCIHLLHLENHLYVTDLFGHMIYKVDDDGNVKAEYGGNTVLSGPWGICTDAKGNIFVADDNGILVLDQALEKIGQILHSQDFDLKAPRLVKVTSDGRYLVVVHDLNEIVVFEKAHKQMLQEQQVANPRGGESCCIQ